MCSIELYELNQEKKLGVTWDNHTVWSGPLLFYLFIYIFFNAEVGVGAGWWVQMLSKLSDSVNEQ